ncbi:carboxypeptidase-like regulatory domain-containing protein [Dysgonomonas sp. OttesenSCG-928-M03]|nr:carboxypeptidase-like regulatory domain-containing protein [Dysgonomonas sp. OttesenSCG-928-M03]
MRCMVKYIALFLSVWIISLQSLSAQTEDRDILNRKVQLSKQKSTVYQLLRQISDQSGYLFIYDSQIIDNDKKVKTVTGEYTLQSAIYTITGDRNLKFRTVGNHILLYKEAEAPVTSTKKTPLQKDDTTHIILSGKVLDRISNDPIAYASIDVLNSSIGTISNQDGEFRLILPDTLQNAQITFSHLGYRTQTLKVSLLSGQSATFMLDPEVVPLQEVVVRLVNPIQTIKTMLANRKMNYSSIPVYMTVFYREGVEYKKKNINLTEAVLKLYKTGYQNGTYSDQIKLLKMRKVTNKVEADTLITKMKSGLNSVLMLDIVKNLPDFLELDVDSHYEYAHTDITVIDNRKVNVISFEQKDVITEPLYKGELYIDAENNALLQAKFEINPEYVKKSSEMFVEKKRRNLSITPQSITYIVSYKSVNGIYYISHIRGDLNFSIKEKKRLFSRPLHTWFEMVTCEVDTNNVERLPKSDRLPTRNIFSDTNFKYDKNFWGNFNTIIPEEKLKELIINYFSNTK